VGERSYGNVVTWMVAAVLATLAAVRLLDGSGGAPAGAPVRVEHGPPQGSAGGGGGVYVHVAGAVWRPGLYRLRSSDRVAAAIERAGGPRRRADLASVNLAARLEDGRQIVVPLIGATAGAGPVAGGAGTAKPSLGTVTVEQLEELDGIGPTLAERIVEYRAAHGGFGSLDELRDVDGIGEKRFESLKEALQP
jgi:competence protein ComEA